MRGSSQFRSRAIGCRHIRRMSAGRCSALLSDSMPVRARWGFRARIAQRRNSTSSWRASRATAPLCIGRSRKVLRSTPCESSMPSLQCHNLNAARLRECVTHSRAWAHSRSRQARSRSLQEQCAPSARSRSCTARCPPVSRRWNLTSVSSPRNCSRSPIAFLKL